MIVSTYDGVGLGTVAVLQQVQRQRVPASDPRLAQQPRRGVGVVEEPGDAGRGEAQRRHARPASPVGAGSGTTNNDNLSGPLGSTKEFYCNINGADRFRRLLAI